ncbi:TetR/AcrR family transcriptional regulator [Corynebacterium frankenforstense]|uniref:TetR/AcrR family transcriptional regulator n=1 Tax=Corynebacterium frankenforstense TaxID=1230998 RepID=UPI0009513434|nr:helix-turn-helix domain-containing protein [Corynebacterium frankenforstense]
MSARKRRRGRPPGLTRKVIGAAAMEIVEADGASALTMVRLAEKLGVAPSALYNHISGKDQLLVFVQDEVLSRVDTSALAELARTVRADGARPAGRDRGLPENHGLSRAAGDTGSADAPRSRGKQLRAALEHWARSYRTVLAEQHELIPLIATLPVAGSPNIRNMYEVVARAMLAGGIPDHDVVPVIVAFENFLFGAAMDYNAPPTIFTAGPGDVVTPAFARVLDAYTGVIDGGAAATGRSEAPADPGELIDDSSAAAAGLAGQVEDLESAIEGARNPYAAVPVEWGLGRLLDGVEQIVEDAEG